ncbi:hypothetical protein ABIA32_005395 [Streptacidiphilus sp. MAP12-20]|uniref:hypothetical protein n=1 Tax=Streptacidiphilus sp. MAP12-20 TaxID=3156299 RepID=UPI0035191D45
MAPPDPTPADRTTRDTGGGGDRDGDVSVELLEQILTRLHRADEQRERDGRPQAEPRPEAPSAPALPVRKRRPPQGGARGR